MNGDGGSGTAKTESEAGRKGKVFLVGAGPGDPGLLTLRAAEILKGAEVVVYDRLVNASILGMVPEGAEMLYVGKMPRRHEVPQEEITKLLIEKAREGKVVVRLKGGDPFLFGRGGEEAEALVSEGIDFEVVPGVTSAIAVPAYAGIPLTHRDYSSSVTIVTGHRAGDGTRSVDWGKIARSADTIVVLMGVESLDAIARGLIDGGLSPETPAAVIEKGTTEDQKVVVGTVGTIVQRAREGGVEPPAVIVVGGVAALGGKLSWFKVPRR
ncbi:MAG: uroporphyrinogen-III C-methyltransferase [Candidatus Verstraetearchaeota archaeon]|nr:uroporphyrinogen-III C-methyltransferase [Candidatus Verstraetearchaeota archaeon]